jgi:hypothetical protein
MNEVGLKQWCWSLLNLYINHGEKRYYTRLETIYYTLKDVDRLDVWDKFKADYLDSMYGEQATPIFAMIERKSV